MAIGMGRVGKRRRICGGIINMLEREVGDLSPRSFALRAAASEDLVLRLGIQKKLNKHRGCVNTVSFNADGNILVSGSDDRMVILWDWEFGKVKLRFHTGHRNNIFQARFMPYTNDRILVTCAADGEVRQNEIVEGGEVSTTLLDNHVGWAHKLAIEPGSPHIFYSCGQDGLVKRFDLRTQSATDIIVSKSFKQKASRKIVGLNAITIDPRNPNHIAAAGSDQYARVYDIRGNKLNALIDNFCPLHLVNNEQVGITGLTYSDQSELLASYNDEDIYLFSKNQGLGPCPSLPSDADTDTYTSFFTQDYKGHRNSDTVKGVGFFGPNCEYVVSGSDCGRIFLWEKKGGKLLRAMEGDRDVVNCIVPHPYATMFASSGIEHDIKIWTPNALERAPPVNMEELKKGKRRANFCRFAFPEDLVAQILAQHSRVVDVSEGNAELFRLVMNYGNDGNVDEDAEEDDDDDTEHNDSDGPGDCVVN